MAVIIYKDGQSLKVDPQHVQHHLDIGWSLRPQDEQAQPETQPETPAKTQHSNEEIRHMARQAGLDNWEGAQIKTLRRAMGLDDEQA